MLLTTGLFIYKHFVQHLHLKCVHNLLSVSYTHLDVYKRQVIHRVVFIVKGGYRLYNREKVAAYYVS